MSYRGKEWMVLFVISAGLWSYVIYELWMMVGGY